ncbi:MAG: hypothetical protein EXS38_07910 [Opitutus sp.]|nr:hypothetical protein [Opitutus sp.]
MRWFYRRGLRVLMYHKVSPTQCDALTVTAAQLEQQLRWLREAGFQFVPLAEVLRGPLPAWPVLVTFDDAYVDTRENAQPVLRRLGVPAVVFVPTAFIGKTSSWDRNAQPLMNATQLREFVANGGELAFHSHRHPNYAALSVAQIADDVREGLATLRQLDLPAAPGLAYPYGGRPRDATTRAAMRNALVECGLQLGFRIGNRINRLPLADPFAVQRLGVRGDESFASFQRKLRWGKIL